MRQLQQVLKFESEKEQKALNDYMLAQRHYNEQRQKLRSLEQYRLDYLRQIQQTGKSGVHAQKYHQHLSFVGKLDKACEQQMHVISKAKMVSDQRKNLWQAQQQRRKAVEMLLQKKQMAAQKKADRAEQVMLDELATQKFFRARHA